MKSIVAINIKLSNKKTRIIILALLLLLLTKIIIYHCYPFHFICLIILTLFKYNQISAFYKCKSKVYRKFAKYLNFLLFKRGLSKSHLLLVEIITKKAPNNWSFFKLNFSFKLQFHLNLYLKNDIP